MPKNVRRSLSFEIGAKNVTQPGLASVHRGFSGLISGVSREAGIASQAMSGAIMGNATFAVAAMGAAFVGFAANAASAFVDVERRWAEVTTLMPQTTKAATDQMLADVRAFSRETGFAIQDSISASYQALSAGVEQGNLTGFLETAGQAARAGVTDITTSVDAITSALNAYNLSASHGTSVSDAMFTAIRLGKTTFSELAPVMGPVLPIAASLNTEFTEITASVAALTAQGNPTSIAMTQIRSALVALSKDTEARSIFERVMGMTFAEYQEQGGTLAGALQVVVQEAEKSGQSVIDVFGRVEAANAALALTSEKGADTFKQAMSDTVGATEDAASKIEDTADTSLRILSSWWDDIKLGVGGVISDVAVGALRAVGLVEAATKDSTDSVLGMIQTMREELGTLPDAPTPPTTSPDLDLTQLTPNIAALVGGADKPIPDLLQDHPITLEHLRQVYPLWLAEQSGDEFRLWDDPTIRDELVSRVMDLRRVSGVVTPATRAFRTRPAPRNLTLPTPVEPPAPAGSPFDRALQERSVGGGREGSDIERTGRGGSRENPLAQMATERTVSAVAELVAAISGGGGLRGALDKNTEALLAVHAELEEALQWQTRPADAPVIPEMLRSSDPRFDSRRVINQLAGGRL